MAVFFGLALLLLAASGTGSALAHGKALSIGLYSSVTGQLEKSYTVSVRYAGDQEPVTGATVTFTARKSGGTESLQPVALQAGEPGVYTGKVKYPSAGSWSARLEVTGRSGQGGTGFTETIQEGGSAAGSTDPGATARPGASPEKSSADESLRPATEAPPVGATQGKLDIQLGFSLADTLDVLVYTVHILATVLWVGGIAFLLLVVRPMFGKVPSKRSNARLAETYQRFGNLSLLSVALLAGTGVYNAVFNAPTAGGITDLSTLRGHAYGDTWLAFLGVKIAFFAAMLGVAAFMRFRVMPSLNSKGRSQAQADIEPQAISSARSRLKMLSSVNLALGFAIIGIATALAYVHLISHGIQGVGLIR